MLARDDRAINVYVVLRRQQVTPGAALGGSADDDLVAKIDVELASGMHVEAVLLVEGDAEGWGTALARAWTGLDCLVAHGELTAFHVAGGVECR